MTHLTPPTRDLSQIRKVCTTWLPRSSIPDPGPAGIVMTYPTT